MKLIFLNTLSKVCFQKIYVEDTDIHIILENNQFFAFLYKIRLNLCAGTIETENCQTDLSIYEIYAIYIIVFLLCCLVYFDTFKFLYFYLFIRMLYDTTYSVY